MYTFLDSLMYLHSNTYYAFFEKNIIFEKKHNLWYRISPPHSPACANFSIFFFYLGQKVPSCVMFYLYMKKKCWFFFISVCFPFFFFTALLLSVLYKQLPSCFQLSDHSRLLFPLVFEHISNILIIYPQNLDAFMMPNLQFP